MKKFLYLILCFMTLRVSCISVDSGFTGTKIKYGGETDMSRVYPEGLYTGFKWMFDDIVQYETREKTLLIKSEFLDADNLTIPVEAVVYYQVNAESVNRLHKEISTKYEDRKVIPSVKTALKNVIPKYKALELNTTKRSEADKFLYDLLSQEFPEFYVTLKGVNIIDINIPAQISAIVIEKQVQDERNALAEKKELEQKNLANADIAKAKGAYESALHDAKTKDILSSPKMIDLYRAETERVWAEKGVSPWGNNNVFGSAAVLKGNGK